MPTDHQHRVIARSSRRFRTRSPRCKGIVGTLNPGAARPSYRSAWHNAARQRTRGAGTRLPEVAGEAQPHRQRADTAAVKNSPIRRQAIHRHPTALGNRQARVPELQEPRGSSRSRATRPLKFGACPSWTRIAKCKIPGADWEAVEPASWAKPLAPIHGGVPAKYSDPSAFRDAPLPARYKACWTAINPHAACQPLALSLAQAGGGRPPAVGGSTALASRSSRSTSFRSRQPHLHPPAPTHCGPLGPAKRVSANVASRQPVLADGGPVGIGVRKRLGRAISIKPKVRHLQQVCLKTRRANPLAAAPTDIDGLAAPPALLGQVRRIERQLWKPTSDGEQSIHPRFDPASPGIHGL